MHSTRRNPISLPPIPSSALSHHAHFQTISSGKSTAFLQVYWYRFVDHINGSSVNAHAELIFEGNIGLLHKMLHIMHWNQFLGVPLPPPAPTPATLWPSMLFCQQVRFAHSHSISKWHPGSREAKCQPSKNDSLQFMKKNTLDYLWSITWTRYGSLLYLLA